MKQRGFGILIYMILAIVIMGMMYGLFHYVDTHWETSAGVKKGEASRQALWDSANRKAEAEEVARIAAAELIAKTHAAELAVAQQKAVDYETKWRTARAKLSNQTLAGCTETAITGPDKLATVRFSAGFLRLYDTAWTGDKGEPVFSDQPTVAGQPAASVDTLTPIGPGEVLDNHAENATRCSADRRALNSLIDQIEKLRAGWK